MLRLKFVEVGASIFSLVGGPRRGPYFFKTPRYSVRIMSNIPRTEFTRNQCSIPWEKKWKEWWTIWPDGKFPRGTYAAKAKNDVKLGKATMECHEGMILAALSMDDKQIEKLASFHPDC